MVEQQQTEQVVDPRPGAALSTRETEVALVVLVT